MKNHSLLSLFLFLLTFSSHAQLITADPPFPTDQQQVVITFNAAEGNAGLANYTGDVYAHTGVITSNSSSDSDWKYVVANWGVNIPKAKLVRVSANIYTLTIGPNIRAYYGVPANETILKLAFVFRSGAFIPGTTQYYEGKTAQNGDIFYDVYEAGLNVTIIQPDQKQILAEPGETIPVSVASIFADSTILKINNVKVAETTTNSLTYSIVAGSSGQFKVKAFAYGDNEVAVDSFLYFVRPPIVVASLPQNIKDGINYINDTTVILSLFAPYKNYVFAIGEFNNWELDNSNYMKRTPDSFRYWIELTGLNPGEEYAYQYFIDGSLRIADPYTEKILDPWNDSYIPNSTYPNLKAYPQGKTTGIVSIFQTEQQQYAWEVEQFSAPANEDLIIYELHIRDFVATRDIKTVMDTLDYLQRLGVNAIELMPINEFEGNDSWGYNPSYYFATDKAYGTKNDYKRFIDECHKRGIAVIIDMVLNHSYGQSPLLQMYFNSANDQPTAQNPWYNQTCPHQPYCWGYDFNHESIHTKNFIDRVNAFWIEEFKVDGYRFDFTKGFTNRTGMNESYDATRIAILKRMADKIWDVNDKAYVILEHFAPNTEERELSAYGMLVWGNMSHSYNQATMGYQQDSDFSGVSYKKRGWSQPHLIGYMESHDEERQMFKNKTFGNNSNAFHNVRNLNVAVKRNAAAASMFLLVPGPKMIWQFGELGYDVSIDEPCRVCPKPIRWNYQQDWNRRLLFHYYSSLIELRKSHDVFRTTDFVMNTNAITKNMHLFSEDMSVAVLANFDVLPKDINPQFYFPGTWYSYFGSDSLIVTDVSAVIRLEPGEFRVYTSKRLTTPDFVGLDELGSGSVPEMTISPNPIRGQFNIKLSLPENGFYKIDLLNTFGQHIETIFEGNADKGEKSIQINNFNEIASGIYLIRLDTGSRYVTKKVVVSN
ncbi:MAG: T9SS type A sorting domain-containing protein [Bacteroidetes bacterium]|nr:T9SS type A sorting domain-containing protein [Bacteroidota bacterium]